MGNREESPEAVEVRDKIDEVLELLKRIGPRAHVDRESRRKLIGVIGASLVPDDISDLVQAAETAKELENIEGKRKLAKAINATCRNQGFAIAHPDSEEPCYLIVIADEYGGKFSLENRQTKKRSHTARNIRDMVPFKVVPVPPDSPAG